MTTDQNGNHVAEVGAPYKHRQIVCLQNHSKKCHFCLKFLALDPWWVSKAICMDGFQAMPRQAVFKRFYASRELWWSHVSVTNLSPHVYAHFQSLLYYLHVSMGWRSSIFSLIHTYTCMIHIICTLKFPESTCECKWKHNISHNRILSMVIIIMVWKIWSDINNHS